MSHAYVLRRLSVTFLPQVFLFLATFCCTSLYAGALTARVALIYPVLRVFTQEITPERAKELGLPEGTELARLITQQDSQASPALAKVNEVLDQFDAFFVGFFGIEGSAGYQATMGTLITCTVLFLVWRW